MTYTLDMRGTQGVKNEKIEQVNEDYHKAKKDMKDQGFRVEGIFDAIIATSTR